MTPRFGDSGKAHSYFAPEPLQDQKVKTGVRANLSIKMVFDTREILEAGCDVFVTESDGYLTADYDPGSAILFINRSCA